MERTVDQKTCKTCGAYWPKRRECRRHAPRPMQSGNVKQVPHAAMWLTVDGEGCHEWAPKDEATPREPIENTDD